MGPGRAGARGPCGGDHRYRPPVPWDDDADDDAARLGPPPPADDRLWRHPSELGAQRLPGLAAGTSGATSTAPRRPASWPLAAAAGVTGALLMFGAIALTGALPEDRKSVVSGKRVSVRVDLGGRRRIKQQTKTTKLTTIG